MKQIQPVFLAMKFSFLIFFFFSLPVGAQSIFQKYEGFLTEPRSYVCYRTDGKLKIDGKLDEVSYLGVGNPSPLISTNGAVGFAFCHETSSSLPSIFSLPSVR